MDEKAASTKAFIGWERISATPKPRCAAPLQRSPSCPARGSSPRLRFNRSAPVGYTVQPDFVNAVAEIETRLGAQALLGELLATEARFGRVRTLPDAPRTLDLDLLLHGDRVIAEPGLIVPHPRMHERAFVLAPLAEIAPDIAIPGKGRAGALLAACTDQKVEKIG